MIEYAPNGLGRVFHADSIIEVGNRRDGRTLDACGL